MGIRSAGDLPLRSVKGLRQQAFLVRGLDELGDRDVGFRRVSEIQEL